MDKKQNIQPLKGGNERLDLALTTAQQRALKEQLETQRKWD